VALSGGCKKSAAGEKDLFTKIVLWESFDSTFWLYWRTMFAFENWHSELEMKLYFQMFIHHIAGLPDFSALKFTRYNQYESLILPMQKYLEAAPSNTGRLPFFRKKESSVICSQNFHRNSQLLV